MSLWRIALLAEKYNRQRLKLPEIAHELGIAERTLRNRMSREPDLYPWIRPDEGGLLFADVADLVEYLEHQRPRADAAAPA